MTFNVVLNINNNLYHTKTVHYFKYSNNIFLIEMFKDQNPKSFTVEKTLKPNLSDKIPNNYIVSTIY